MEIRSRQAPSPFQNGPVREGHASKSVLYLPCSSETCKGEEREFQIMTIHIRKRVSIFRCVICGDQRSISAQSNGSASQETEHKNKE